MTRNLSLGIDFTCILTVKTFIYCSKVTLCFCFYCVCCVIFLPARELFFVFVFCFCFCFCFCFARLVDIKVKTLQFLLGVQFSSVQLLSHVRLFATPWITAHQASLSITDSRSSLRFTTIESVMPSSHFILCRPLLLLPPIPPSITVFSNELTLHMRWPKYWSFSFSIIPSKEIPGLISFWMDWLDLFAV